MLLADNVLFEYNGPTGTAILGGFPRLTLQGQGGWFMTSDARFAHVNLIARDWRRLARFYEQVLGCVPVPPERKLQGKRLEKGTGVPGARIEGTHLRLPGFGDQGPTLEIFQYDQFFGGAPTAVNQRGLAHVAFAVEDVKATQDAVLAAGGSNVGELVTLPISETRAVTFAYVRDPEGNIIELQKWSTQ